MRNSVVIVDGKDIAEHWLRDCAVQVQALGVPVHIAAVWAGDHEGIESFVRLKQKAARSCRIEFSTYHVEADQEGRARETIEWLASDDSVHGVFVELPLPDGWDERSLLALVPSNKDVDVISPEGEQAFAEGRSSLLPPSVRALERVMQVHDIDRRGRAVVVGNGRLVGRPCAHWLTEQGFDVSIVDVNTEHPERIAGDADVLVCGAGVPELVTGEWVKEGASVFDFGYSKRAGSYVGDVQRSSVSKKAGLLTPVPGGMGPLVVAATLENLLALSVD